MLNKRKPGLAVCLVSFLLSAACSDDTSADEVGASETGDGDGDPAGDGDGDGDGDPAPLLEDGVYQRLEFSLVDNSCGTLPVDDEWAPSAETTLAWIDAATFTMSYAQDEPLLPLVSTCTVAVDDTITCTGYQQGPFLPAAYATIYLDSATEDFVVETPTRFAMSEVITVTCEGMNCESFADSAEIAAFPCQLTLPVVYQK